MACVLGERNRHAFTKAFRAIVVRRLPRVVAFTARRVEWRDWSAGGARLFRDKAELAKARALIEKHGYWRRKEELEDAEAALGMPVSPR